MKDSPLLRLLHASQVRLQVVLIWEDDYGETQEMLFLESNRRGQCTLSRGVIGNNGSEQWTPPMDLPRAEWERFIEDMALVTIHPETLSNGHSTIRYKAHISWSCQTDGDARDSGTLRYSTLYLDLADRHSGATSAAPYVRTHEIIHLTQALLAAHGLG